MLKTKIICTLGPSSKSEKILKEMVGAGMACARINLSHGTQAENAPTIELVKKVRKETGKPVAIMLDTKGPEIRVGMFDGGSAALNVGATFTIYQKEMLGTSEGCCCSYKDLAKDVKIGNKILLSDGLIVLKIIAIEKGDIKTKVIHGGVLTNRKSMFLPDVKLSFPFLSIQDKKDLKFAIENDVDYIAASFVSLPKDVLDIRQFLNANGGNDIKIISKIESALGVKNIDKIIDLSDGIMVARGDLGVELPIETLPRLQKMIIKKANEKGKIAITATEMLESMTEKSRPTRAEVSDVANAVYDESSAIMLSGETAVGKNPVLVVETMAKIATQAEKDSMDVSGRFESLKNDISDCISHSAVVVAKDINAKAMVAFTTTGFTALMLGRFKPSIPVVAVSSNFKIANQLALGWGIVPVKEKDVNESNYLSLANNISKKLKFAKKGDMIVVSAGIPFGKTSFTNVIKVEEIK